MAGLIDRVDVADLKIVIRTINSILKTGRLQGQFRGSARQRSGGTITPADRAYFTRLRQTFVDELARRSAR